jgi:hypothetical protein
LSCLHYSSKAQAEGLNLRSWGPFARKLHPGCGSNSVIVVTGTALGFFENRIDLSCEVLGHYSRGEKEYNDGGKYALHDRSEKDAELAGGRASCRNPSKAVTKWLCRSLALPTIPGLQSFTGSGSNRCEIYGNAFIARRQEAPGPYQRGKWNVFLGT